MTNTDVLDKNALNELTTALVQWRGYLSFNREKDVIENRRQTAILREKRMPLMKSIPDSNGNRCNYL